MKRRHFFLCFILLCCLVYTGYGKGKHKTAAAKKKGHAQKAIKKTPLDKKLDFFVEKLRKEQFTVLEGKKDIPEFIKLQMPGFNDQSLADTNEKYQEPGEYIDSALPGRKIVFLAKSEDIFIIAYIKGGKKISDHVALIQYENGQAIDVLPRNGCHNCKSVKEIVHFINVDRVKKR